MTYPPDDRAWNRQTPQGQPPVPEQYDPGLRDRPLGGGQPAATGWQQPPQAPAGPPWASPGYQYGQPPPGTHEARSAGPRHGRPRRSLFAGIALVAVIAAGGTAWALTGGGASPAAHLTCKQQYAGWKTGPARPAAVRLAHDFAKVRSAARSQDIVTMTSALKTVGSDAAALQAYPIPVCADPAGYWGQMVSRLQAAGDNAGTATGLGALIAAAAPLQGVTGIENKLNAELKRTTGGTRIR